MITEHEDESAGLALARLAADAVLYEGYLLYPYRATARKNQVRWQFGVLGTPGASDAGLGEEARLATQCLWRPSSEEAQLTLYLRFLQLQRRSAERRETDGSSTPVEHLEVDGTSFTSWDEAVEVERRLSDLSIETLRGGVTTRVDVDGGEDVQPLGDRGRLVRRRWPLSVTVQIDARDEGLWTRLTVDVRNSGRQAADKDDAICRSTIGTHLLLVAQGSRFGSVIDPPADAVDAARTCQQYRCWPVLAGDEGDGSQESRIVLAAPIILYDFPAVAPESATAMFDSTEIDEILTLRVLTLTDDEKAQARATDPQAAAIIDRCEQMSPQDLQRLHGVLRDPQAGTSMLTGDDWWAAEAAATVSPETASVVVSGTRLSKGSLVTLRPTRRADAHDLFYAGQRAQVSGVHVDLDGETHVAVTLLDDPAAELHDWYGRYLYFAPDELEPVPPRQTRNDERSTS